MLLLLFSGTKHSAQPPVVDTTLQTILTRWDYEKYRKRRPVFKTLLAEAEYDLKEAYDRLQSVAFTKRARARKEYEELKEIVEELRSDNLLRQRIKKAEAEAVKSQLRAEENRKKLREKFGPGLLNTHFLKK